MKGRNRRGYRQASMKARAGIATAVLIGGGAAGVAVVASNNHGTTQASSASYIMGIRQHISAQQAMNAALSQWGRSHTRALTTLAQMVPMRNFTTVRHGATRLAMQRGVVVFASKQFMVVKSANGAMHVWWLSGRTTFANVTNSATGMAALIGNNNATMQAMVNHNPAPMASVLAGSVNAQAQAAAAKPATVTTAAGGAFTITITFGTTTVTFTFNPATGQTTMGGTTTGTGTTATPPATPPATGTATPPATMTATPPATMTPTPPATMTPTPSGSVTPTTSAMPTPTGTTTMPVTTVKGIAVGDVVSVIGTRSLHGGHLTAKLVLFSVPATVMATTPATPTAPVTPTNTVSPAPSGSLAPTKF